MTAIFLGSLLTLAIVLFAGVVLGRALERRRKGISAVADVPVTRPATETEALRRVQLLEHAPEIVYTVSPDGLFTSLNLAFEQLLGWKREDWIGRPFVDLVVPEARESSLIQFRHAAQRPGLSNMRTAVLTSNGDRRVVDSLMIEDAVVGGKPTSLVGFARDVTRANRMRERMRRSERQLAESQRIARLGSWEVDLRRNEAWWSAEHYRLFGVPISDGPIDMSTSFVNVIETADDLAAHMAAVIEHGFSEWDLHLELPDGEKRTVHSLARLVRDPNGKPLRVVGTAEDVTARRQADQQLLESETRFRLVARATNDAVWDWNIVTDQRWCGDGFEKLFGYGEQDGIHESAVWAERLHPEDRQRVLDTLREAMESGQSSWSCEYRFRRTNGAYAIIFDRGQIMRENGLPVRMIGAMMDITQRKQLEEQLAQAQRVSSLGRIAASIAHEFNNVLMGIQPNVELIQRRGPVELQTASAAITRSVKRGKHITEEILRFTRPADPTIECLNVESFMHSWLEDVRPMLGTDIAIRLETGDPELYINADPLQLHQVLMNLILNSRDAMPDGGIITVAAEPARNLASFPPGVIRTPERFVHIRITDTGRGIPSDQLGMVFEPLFTTKKGGTGLGLAISYQVVTRHGGQMFVESEAGVGTTFHIFVPTALPSRQPMLPEERPTLFARRVLLVEDEPLVAEGIAALMELEGIQIEIAPTGAAAIASLSISRPDAIVLDIGLPDCDGVALYEMIAQSWPDLPVIFSSGHGDLAKLDRYLSRPNVRFLRKPYEFSTLQQSIAAALGNATPTGTSA